MSYLIIYDIKQLDNATRLRVSRRLRKLRASKLQQSVWELEGLAGLQELASWIKQAGGKVLESKNGYLIVELSGAHDEIERVIMTLGPDILKEVARSGQVLISREVT